jgi:glycosyltransferase involved in cell wall biosynthesis
MPEPARRPLRHPLWLFTISFLIYVSSAAGTLELGDDWSMLQVTSSIVERGAIDVPSRTPGSTPGADGRYYSKYGLGQSLLAVPFYVVGTRAAAWTGNRADDAGLFKQATILTYLLTMLGMLATALSVALFYFCARRVGFDQRASAIAALALALGTFVWYWARTFMTEPPTMLMLLVAFYAQLRDAEKPSPRWLVLAGAALGYAVLLRVAAVVVLPGFGLWLLWETWRNASTIRSAAVRIAAWFFPVAAGITAVLTYNFVRFATFSDIGYGSTAAAHLGGKLWVGLYGMLFSPGRSMFLYAPMLIASAVGWVSLWRTRRRVAVAVALIVVPYVLFHSRLPYWDGGGCWSPRYISTIMPLLMLGMAALVARGLSRSGWIAIGLLGVVSVSVQLLGVTVSCVPYAAKMYATPETTDRIMWHMEYSPLAEHARSAFAHEMPVHVAPVMFQSTTLAWLQGLSLTAGLVLLAVYGRTLAGAPREAGADAAQAWLREVNTEALAVAAGASAAARLAVGGGHQAVAPVRGSGSVLTRSAPPELEVSIVMPCLNEADTLETCIAKAREALDGHRVEGEIIVADNGSTDGSVAIAQRMGARVVHVKARGYGNALMEGIAAAKGQYIIMGDADDSYDFREIPRFVDALRQGYALVQGCRLPAGGGRVLPGAMPLLHRWWGNPMFSLMARRWFKAPIHDVYCGLRGFTKTLYNELDQRCTGMEFATEMIIKSSLRHARIGEVPITLHPDGRTSHAPHLRTFRDGWRTLRFFLMYSPRWLFLIPGAGLTLLGVLGYVLALPGVTIRGITFDAHTLLFASLAILCGYQSIVFALFAKTFAISEGLMPEDPRLTRFFTIINLERGLIIGAGSLALGLILLAGAVNQWRLNDFGRLEYRETMRWVIPGATLTALGFQTLLSSFFVSILGLRRR